ncbi:glutamate--tRNA ligase [Clostridia bacterium]|nr:glutamate--tRNA ligase [Clostridia bacterium]
MHIGNLKSVVVEYLIAKSQGGRFILRIEDTDRARYVEGAEDAIYRALKMAGIQHDEGPDIGGDFGPYVQSERKAIYMEYAKKLVETGAAYYCFCDKERIASLVREGSNDAVKYDRHCLNLPKEEIAERLKSGASFVIRQLIPQGETTFSDEVFGEIKINNEELDDQILIKSDGLPTYNFANVVDDHLMEITHVVRGAEYLSSTPKYNLLYEAFGWKPPKYVHVGLLLNENGEKMSKRRGDASFEDLIEAGYLPQAIVNYVALLGWSPPENREVYTLEELSYVYDISRRSKAPSLFDMKKLTWFNGEHIKAMPFEDFFQLAEPYVRKAVSRTGVNIEQLAKMTQTRVNFIAEVAFQLDFIDNLPAYSTELFVNKKMKTDAQISLKSLTEAIPFIENISDENWNNDALYTALCSFAASLNVKNGQILWPVRTALSGKLATPCGASEIMEILGKEETVSRLKKGIELLK